MKRTLYKLFPAMLLLLATTFTLHAQVQQEWAKSYATYTHDYGAKPTAMVVDKYGNTYVTGFVLTRVDTIKYYDPIDDYYSEYLDPVYDYATIKYDSQGNQKWVTLFNGPDNYIDQAVDIQVDEQGNVFVTGKTVSSSLHDGSMTIKYNAQGAEVWQVANADGVSRAISLDPQGNLYVVGSGDDVIKYDTNGILLWKRSYEKAILGSIGQAIAIDKVGNIYVTSRFYDFATKDDFITSKYDTQGNRLWVQRYDSKNQYNLSGSDTPTDIELDAQGNVYVSGNSNYGAGTIIKYDNQGNQVWLANGFTFAIDNNIELLLDNQGNIIVNLMLDALSSRAKIIKLNNQGSQVWSKATTVRSAGIALDKQGNVYVNGQETQYGSSNYLTTKYSANGDSLWSVMYPDSVVLGSYSYATDIAVDEFSNVYVTGVGSNDEFVTIKYSQSLPVPVGTSKVRINCGGSDFKVANGLTFKADAYFSGLTKTSSTGGEIAATVNDALYYTDRVADVDKGTFQYQIPVTNGKYQVNLFLAETYFTASGKRVMSVKAEGNPILSNYDIFAAQGKRTAKMLSYIVTVADGNVTLDFSASMNRPKINAIEIVPAPANAARQEESELETELTTSAALVAYPNPFADQASIRFTAEVSGKASVAVYDLSGSLVKGLFEGELEAGVTQELTLDGAALPSGIYLVKATSPAGVSHLKLVLTK